MLILKAQDENLGFFYVSGTMQVLLTICNFWQSWPMKFLGSFAPSLFVLVLTSVLGFKAQSLEAIPGQFLVRLDSGVDSVKNFEATTGSRILRSLPGTRLFLVERSSLENLDYALHVFQRLGVEAEPNRQYQISKVPNDPEFYLSWGLDFIQAPQAWGLTTGSSKVLVAVIDTGMNYKHRDLVGNLWVNVAEKNGIAGVDDDGNGFIDDIHGYDFVNNDGDPMDDHTHGTHVAGIIGASGNNNEGSSGVSWRVKILPIKALDSRGSGTTEMAINAINYAVQMKAQILNNSWGGTDDSAFLLEAIERSSRAGAVFVAASGNSFVSNDQSPHYPANSKSPNVISVAALKQDGSFASFSNFGAKTVHIAAPGVGIYSTYGSRYQSLSGTSMAAPFVSGVAALLLAKYPDLSGVQVKERILKSAIRKAHLRTKVSTQGVVNAYYAVSGETPPPDPNEPSQWSSKKRMSISSAHPYGADEFQSWEISQPGANEIALYFEKFELEDPYDRLFFYNEKGRELFSLSGSEGLGWSTIVRGDYVRIVLRSDARNELYGFDLTEIAYR